MRLEARKYLLDIQVAAHRVERFTRGKQFAQYLEDEMLRAAVERQFGIVGAALAAFTREGPAGAEERVDRMMQIPGLMQVVLFRA